MFVTLWKYGYSEPWSSIENNYQTCLTSVNHCLTMVNQSQPWSWSTKVNHSYVQRITTIRLCSSHLVFTI